MKRESIRRRKRSFCAMLFAVLIVFNMMPMNAFATTYELGIGRDITVNSNQLISPGDKVLFVSSGYVYIDGDDIPSPEKYRSDGEYYENANNSGKYYIGTKELGANNLLLSSLYKVSFDTNGGSANPATQEVIWGEKANRPADPTKAGDTFVKWVKVKNGVETDFSFNTTITEDTKLKAKWSSELNSGDNHTHSYTWKISKEPTATSDGEEIYVCECGHIAQINILPGSAAFETDMIAKIKKAPVNGIVTIETRIWNSLSKDVRDALVERPDVTLKISFLSEGYKGIPLKVTIPTGIDRYALWDEKGWLGLCRAGSTLGYDQ
ncbi:MAG: InlB B-repeat-containing protein [Lachnospiraceae bacterium]|nr:InlB B-repeat-containing protein [Lachnospiraceae bacterium]